MSQQCSICGKKPGRGNKKEERGKPKYLGGNGAKPPELRNVSSN